MCIRASLLACIILVACDPPSDESSSDRASPADEPPATAKPVESPRQPIAVRVTALRRRSDAVEIDVELDRALPPLDRSRPRLRIGDEVATRSKHTDGRLDRLTFLVPPDQFERMPDGAPMALQLGLHSSAGVDPPLLDKARLEDRR